MSQLRRLRVNKRLTIPQLAAASGVSAEHIRDLERGEIQNPRPATLGKLADVLGVETAELDPQLIDEAA